MSEPISIPSENSFSTCIQFPAGSGSVKIYADGRVELDGCELDEAALAFWRMVETIGMRRRD